MLARLGATTSIRNCSCIAWNGICIPFDEVKDVCDEAELALDRAKFEGGGAICETKSKVMPKDNPHNLS